MRLLAANRRGGSRHRVVAAAAPRMAAENAAHGKPKPFNEAMFLNGLDGVLRASGGEAACRREHGRHVALVQADGKDKQFFHGKTDTGCIAWRLRDGLSGKDSLADALQERAYTFADGGGAYRTFGKPYKRHVDGCRP